MTAFSKIQSVPLISVSDENELKQYMNMIMFKLAYKDNNLPSHIISNLESLPDWSWDIDTIVTEQGTQLFSYHESKHSEFSCQEEAFAFFDYFIRKVIQIINDDMNSETVIEDHKSFDSVVFLSAKYIYEQFMK